jgi:hypothetical protein
MNEYFSKKKDLIIIVSLFIIFSSVLYLTTDAYDRSKSMSGSNMGSVIINNDVSMFKDIEIKTTYTPDGIIKIFAQVEDSNMEKYNSRIGSNIPWDNTIIIGSLEADMMIEEKLFSRPGDTINDLFGMNIVVGGILVPTGTFADDFHFLSQKQYDLLNADSSTMFVKFKDEKSPELFYYYDKNNPTPLKLEFVDGGIQFFEKQTINGKTYYPLIIGYDEAQMMIEEKLFTKTGDTLEGFFEKDVIIAGILKDTNTGIDMAHIVEKDFFDKSIEGVLV